MSAEYGVAEFAVDLQQQVISRTELEGEDTFREAAFVQTMVDYLGDAGELEDVHVCLHRATGIQVAGWSLSENDENLDLIVAIYTDQVPPRTVTRTEVNTAFRRLQAFFAKACKGYHFQLEESTAAFDAAQRIAAVWGRGLMSIRFILVTDGVVVAEPPTTRETDQLRASCHIWDVERLFRFASSGREREAIEIDFQKELNAPIPCLAQPASNEAYAAYLAIIPGQMLAKLYGLHGARLLERNVRSFLQARGKINSGIRKTIRQEPHMFLAYNNGLSATAERAEVVDIPGNGRGIASVRDLQIVNGGQTMASIYHAVKKDKADLSALFVQMKLTVLNDPAKMDDVIPLISEFANSQNKVQQADLRANDAYHRRIEHLSRSVWAPATDGYQRQTHWFYERARGQYKDELARAGTTAKQNTFLSENPKSQQFGKTELAKYVCSWDQKPHVVSKGAQFCFAHFSAGLGEHLKGQEVDPHYFQMLIAKAILFRAAERLIGERLMKPNGYTGFRANLVTYSLARLSYAFGKRIDLGAVWTKQKLSAGTEDAIVQIAGAVWGHINKPRSGANVTQYCKTEDCWKSFLEVDIPVPATLHQELVAAGRQQSSTNASGKRQSDEVNGVGHASADFWLELAAWGKSDGQLTGLEQKVICDLALEISYGGRPAARLVGDGTKILEKAHNLGFRK